MHKPTCWFKAALSLAVFSILLCSTNSHAHFPITSSGVPLAWDSSSLPLSFLLHADGAPGITDDSEYTAIRQAFQRWEDIASSTIDFEEDTSSDSSRTDFGATDIHLIMFDDDDLLGFFPGSSSTLAVTPVSFNSVTGEILDADIIFNSNDHTFSTDLSASTYDVQSIAVHEIGHFIGLDHCAIHATSMYPFSEQAQSILRSLHTDDIAGATDLYTDSNTTGSISGIVEHSADNSPIVGAHVVALNDDGIVIASTYSASDGSFQISRLVPDTYNVYAQALISPVGAANLSSSFGASVDTDFQLEFSGGNAAPTNLVVTNSNDTDAGTISADPTGTITLTASSKNPAVSPQSQFVSLAIFGNGWDGVDETISVSGADVSIFFSALTNGSPDRYDIILQIGAAAELGSRDIMITTAANEITTLTGLIEVVSPTPTLASSNPAFGVISGGSSVTLTGTGFVSGAKVYFGDELATNIMVNSSTQIVCDTPQQDTGTVDISVENPDAQVAALDDGFEFGGDPSVDALFPSAGNIAGGTTVILTGSNFDSGAIVSFGGTMATSTTVDSSSQITCVSPAIAVSTVDIVVTNPVSYFTTVSNAFSFVNASDPVITSISPESGGVSGSTNVTIRGADFQDGATLRLGVSLSGEDGSTLSAIDIESSSKITAKTTAVSRGDAHLMISNPDGTGFILQDAYEFLAEGGGGGGGGCGALPPILRNDWPSIGSWFLPYVLLIAYGIFVRMRSYKKLKSARRFQSF